MKTIALLAFTENGRILGKKVERLVLENKLADEVIVYDNTVKASIFVDDCFTKVDGIIFIGAIGIATRMISKNIRSKDVDPAVVVIDELGNYVIPILSGHLGGGNFLGNALAYSLDATPIVTTATDINHKFAVDIWTKKVGCVIDNISMIKYISSAVLEDKEVGLVSDFSIVGELPNNIHEDDNLEVGICVSYDEGKKPFEKTLNAIPRNIVMGVGCRRDSNPFQFEKFILDVLEKNKISLNAIEKIWSIDLKADENCIKRFSQKYDIPFFTSSADDLNKVEGEFTSSNFVKKITGVDNVCERSAVLGTGSNNRDSLILPKTSDNGFTIALAARKWECKF